MSGRAGWRGWRHVTKVDPGRPWDRGLLQLVLASGTDAILLGGTQDVVASEVGRLLCELRALHRELQLAVEVSSMDCLQPGADLYLVPVVLNSRDPRWIVGAHQRALLKVGAAADLVQPLPEFYIVLNPDAAVARLTDSICPLTPEQVAAYVRTARLIMGARLIYLEGSGSFCGVEPIRAAAAAAGDCRLLYGGGISSARQAELAGRWADTVVVGNLIYSEPRRLAETVRAVRE